MKYEFVNRKELKYNAESKKKKKGDQKKRKK